MTHTVAIVDLGRSDDQILESWKTHLTAEEGKADLTISRYLREVDLFRRFLEPRGLKLKEVGRDDIVAYKEAQLRAGLRANSVNGKVDALHSLYNFLVLTDELEKTPLRFVKRLKVDHRRQTILTIQEIEKLLSVIDCESTTGLRDYAMMILVAGTKAGHFEGEPPRGGSPSPRSWPWPRQCHDARSQRSSRPRFCRKPGPPKG